VALWHVEWQTHQSRAGHCVLSLCSRALISSVLDLVRWNEALDTGSLLTKEGLAQMWTPVTLNDGNQFEYGFGWFIRPVPSHRTVAHGGGLPGFSAAIWKFIDDKLTVILLPNCETAETMQMSLSVAGFYVPALATSEVKGKL
jgi:D-alanyl-D-alanine carboxypeptidase